MKFHLGQYVPGDSFLHTMDPRVKLVLSVVYMILMFFIQGAWGLLIYAAFLLVLWGFSKIPFRRLGQSLKPILFLAAITFLLNAFTIEGDILFSLGPLELTDRGLYVGLRLCFRLFLLVLSSSLLLTYTTSPLVIADALEDLFSPLKRFGFPAHELSLMISIALRFVPTIAEESEKLMRAQSSRGANYDTGGLFKRIKGLLTILIPLFVSSVQRALDLATAMEARAYFGGEGRTRLRVFAIQKRDLVMIVASVILWTLIFIIDNTIPGIFI